MSEDLSREGQETTADLWVKIQDVSQISSDQIPQPYHCGFAYTIEIHNDGTGPVQVLGRKWMIKQEDGTIETVEGEGVVGEQPVIAPGSHYVYTSYCLLYGATGAMWGFYFGKNLEDVPVLWTIPKFEMVDRQSSN